MRPETRGNLRLALASTTLFLVGGELALRALHLPREGLGAGALGTPVLEEGIGAALTPYQLEDRERLWRLRPGATHEEHHRGFRRRETWSMSINARGRRGPDRRPGTGGPVVLCLGDSVTMGFGSNDHETYPESLQALLEPDLPGVAVVNAGSNGYSSEQGRIWLDELLAELAPSVVIASFGANDDAPAPFADAAVLAGGTGVRALQRLLRGSRIYEALRREIVHRRLVRAIARGKLGPRVPLERYRENLAAIVAASRGAGATPLLVAPPSKYEHFQETAARSWPAPISVYRHVASSVAHEERVLLLDHPLLSGRLYESEAHFLDWCHPDHRALCLLAQELAPLVRAALRERAARS